MFMTLIVSLFLYFIMFLIYPHATWLLTVAIIVHSFLQGSDLLSYLRHQSVVCLIKRNRLHNNNAYQLM